MVFTNCRFYWGTFIKQVDSTTFTQPAKRPAKLDLLLKACQGNDYKPTFFLVKELQHWLDSYTNNYLYFAN